MTIEMSQAPFAALATDESPVKNDRNVWQSVKRGAAGKCPKCGEGKLFYRYLKVNDRCPECGEEFFHHRADDAPPYLTILVTAHIVGTGMLATSSFAPDLPLVYEMTIWPALTLVLSLILLPIFKGGLIAHQWALRMHGFETAGATPASLWRVSEDATRDGDANSAAAPLAASTDGHHAVRPQAAASMVLVDASAPEPKVLLGRRHPKLGFLPGKYVFPGGRLETDDRLMAAVGALPETSLEKLVLRRNRHFPGPHAFALAAIRETFEETGLLLGSRSDRAGATAIPPAWQTFTDHGFTPNLAPLHFIARAITPPTFPRRFDTSFFAVDISAIAHRIDGCVTQDTELVELVWLSLSDAAALDIPRITAMILLDLARKIAADFDGHLPVPFFYERKQRWIRDEL